MCIACLISFHSNPIRFLYVTVTVLSPKQLTVLSKLGGEDPELNLVSAEVVTSEVGGDLMTQMTDTDKGVKAMGSIISSIL